MRRKFLHKMLAIFFFLNNGLMAQSLQAPSSAISQQPKNEKHSPSNATHAGVGHKPVFDGLLKQSGNNKNNLSKDLGILPGDTITKIDGVAYKDQLSAIKAINKAKKSTKPVTITVKRQGKEKNIIWHAQ